MNDTATSASPASRGITPSRRLRVGGLALGGLLILAALGGWAWSVREASPDALGQPVAVGEASAVPSPAPVVATGASREELRQQAERHPRDGRTWALLAYAEFEADAYADAAAAFEKAVAVSRKVANDPGVLCDWADTLGMTQGGSLKGRPTELVSRALALRPAHPKALEMAGSAAYERREFALAADYWHRLLLQMPEGSTGHRALADGIARAERLAATAVSASR